MALRTDPEMSPERACSCLVERSLETDSWLGSFGEPLCDVQARKEQYQGLCQYAPLVSEDETKAARLKRYAELRWSSDTSSSP